MSVARKWVFPIIRLVVFTAIAVALVKIAFFADSPQGFGPEIPTGAIVEPQVPVMVGTVYNDVAVQATVAADDAVPVKATLAGEVVQLFTSQGSAVASGANVVTIRAEVFGKTGGSYMKYSTVTAPATGTVSNLAVIVGQIVSVGDVIGQVAPPTFNVSGTLSPDQLYRLLNDPQEATITVYGGPAPFTCVGLKIETTLAGAAGEGSTGGTSVECAVPTDVTVFNGLQAEMSIPGGVAENVLVVPVTAVEGAAGVGNVYVVLPDGSTEIREVTLGLNDGISVEVIDGLSEGELVLQFVPGAAEVPGGPGFPGGPGIPIDPGFPVEEGEVCYDDGRGGIICEGTVK